MSGRQRGPLPAWVHAGRGHVGPQRRRTGEARAVEQARGGGSFGGEEELFARDPLSIGSPDRRNAVTELFHRFHPASQP